MRRILSSIYMLVVLFTVLITTPNAFASTPIVKICDDEGEWPPYVFFDRNDIKNPSPTIGGITVEIFYTIFSEANIPMKIVPLPWKRCLKETEDFQKYKKYEVFNNGNINEWREKNFLRTHALYQTRVGYFYDSRRFPNGLEIKTLKELSQYTICGVAGFNYEPYYQSGLTRDIDIGAHNSYQAFRKMVLGRCEVLFSAIEPILGAGNIGRLVIPKSVRYGALNTPRTTFYSWVSKSSPRAEQIRDVINQGLDNLHNSCRYERFFRNYLPQGSGLPLAKGCK
ncbi:transporter substrate-binding domain-containing protein [Vibrio profundum]|uniref:substrate-binding periplasmic protein n=1 Tax=Vibrio profundum TaxID=2910247 RepID=UPI003D0AA9AE